MNSVLRDGDVISRVGGPWTATVHRYLEFILRNGITWAPRPLGFDGARETLTYIPGTVPTYPLPDWVWPDAVLVDGATRLRELHDASVGFFLDSAVWQAPARVPLEVICHNDFAPHNLVFTDGAITGAIDFDFCSPGPRMWDIAYFATRIVPLTATQPPGAPDVSDRALMRRRIELILAAYGSQESWTQVVRVAITRLLDLADFSVTMAAELGKAHLLDDAAGYRRDAAHLAEVIGLPGSAVSAS